MVDMIAAQLKFEMICESALRPFLNLICGYYIFR